MRLIPMAGLALGGLVLSFNALACDTVVPAEQVSIQGPGKYCLSANRTMPIDIQGSDIELDCRTRSVINPVPGGASGPGIRVGGGERVTVRNCRVDGYAVGIDMHVFAEGQLLNNTVVRAVDAPITVHGSGFSDPLRPATRIVGNRVIGYSDPNQPQPNGQPALRISNLGRAVISTNVVAGHRGRGLWLMDSPDAQLSSNQFLDLDLADRAIQLDYSPRARIVHNTVMQRQPSLQQALAGATEATCVENVVINIGGRSGFHECAVTRHNVEQPLPPPMP